MSTPTSTDLRLDLKKIITDESGTELLVREAERLGKNLSPSGLDLTTSQIRSLFGEVRQISTQWNMTGTPSAVQRYQSQARRRMILLKPKMAYRVGKETNKRRRDAIKELVDVLSSAIDQIIAEPNEQKQREHFGRFADFFEAILAYHKFSGGKS